MKANVNENCIGCGLCENICPEVFRIGDRGVAEVVGDITPANQAPAEEARGSCPVDAIEIE